MELMLQMRGFSPIIIILVVVVLGFAAFLGYRYFSGKQVSSPSKIPMTEKYENPFDEEVQYTNPFDSSAAEYQNPFNSLSK